MSDWQALQLEFNGTDTARFVLHNNKNESDLYADNLDKKQTLSVENVAIYSKLLDDTKQLFSAGYKTEYDVSLLENSLQMSKLDSKVYD